MISIVIPIYNFNVSPLVNAMYAQLEESNIAYEIILGDDASTETFHNEKLAHLANVIYFQAPQNYGRSKMRNVLAQKAQYPYLIFMDCDVESYSKNYILHYINEIKNIKDTCFVINGGVGYRPNPPEKQYFLRWFYGTHREMIPAVVRNKNPYRSFTPFNVLMTKSVFENVQFDESLTTYGHEDTLFGIDLAKQKIPIFHIDNTLYHIGLDENSAFLRKIETSIQNLKKLMDQKKIEDSFIQENKLLKTAIMVKKWKISGLFLFFFIKMRKKIEKKLCFAPSLFWLDIYKLGLVLKN